MSGIFKDVGDKAGNIAGPSNVFEKLNPNRRSKIVARVNDPLDIFGANKRFTLAEAEHGAELAKKAARKRLVPLPDEEAIKRMQRLKAARRGSSGRASTILTDDFGSDTLGGG